MFRLRAPSRTCWRPLCSGTTAERWRASRASASASSNVSVCWSRATPLSPAHAGGDRQHVGAERRELLVHRRLRAAAEREHRDHRGDADDDPEHRERGSGTRCRASSRARAAPSPRTASALPRRGAVGGAACAGGLAASGPGMPPRRLATSWICCWISTRLAVGSSSTSSPSARPPVISTRSRSVIPVSTGVGTWRPSLTATTQSPRPSPSAPPRSPAPRPRVRAPARTRADVRAQRRRVEPEDLRRRVDVARGAQRHHRQRQHARPFRDVEGRVHVHARPQQAVLVRRR